jgi:hypothetical protein
MAHFKGAVSIGGVARQVEVSGEPTGRTAVRVDRVTVYDKKPFVARDTVSLDVGGQAVTLTWRHPGLTRLECDITAGGVTTTLAGVTSRGEVVAPLDEATRRRLQARTAGVIAVFGGLALSWWNYASLQEGYYIPQTLFIVPTAILGGLFALLFPSKVAESGRTAEKVVLVVSLLVTLGLGFLFSRWFLATFAPASP